MLATPIARLRLAGLIESLSWFALLFIAMPIKWMPFLIDLYNGVPTDQAKQGSELFVQIVGPIHGGLWVLYILAIIFAARKTEQHPGLPRNVTILALVCTFLPFPIPLLILDPKLRAIEQADSNASGGA